MNQSRNRLRTWDTYSVLAVPSDPRLRNDRRSGLLELRRSGMAAEHKISFSTVNTHVNRVCNKLYVNSATEAVAPAIRKGMG